MISVDRPDVEAYAVASSVDILLHSDRDEVTIKIFSTTVKKKNSTVYVIYDEGFFDTFIEPLIVDQLLRIYKRIVAHELYRVKTRNESLPYWYDDKVHTTDIYAYRP